MTPVDVCQISSSKHRDSIYFQTPCFPTVLFCVHNYGNKLLLLNTRKCISLQMVRENVTSMGNKIIISGL